MNTSSADRAPTHILPDTNLDYPTPKMDPCHEKKVKDAWLVFLAYANRGTDVLPKEARKAAKQIQRMQKKIKRSIDRGACKSGALAALAAFFNSVPGVGLPCSAFLSFAANHQGFVDSTLIGFRYAEACDRKQDLLKETEIFFKSLSTRLLDRYIKSQIMNEGYLMQKEQGFSRNLLTENERVKLYSKIPEIIRLSKSLQLNLPWLRSSKIFSPEEMEAVLKPLQEVCEFIGGQRDQFSVEGLHNESVTMRTHYALKLTQRLIMTRERLHQRDLDEQREKLSDLEKELAKMQQQAKRLKSHYRQKYKAKYKQQTLQLAKKL